MEDQGEKINHENLKAFCVRWFQFLSFLGTGLSCDDDDVH